MALKIKLRSNLSQVLPSIRCPVMILHAEDDDTISIQLAKKLFAGAKKSGRSSNNILMKQIPGQLGFGHNHIHRAEELPVLLKKAWGLSSEEAGLLKQTENPRNQLLLAKKGTLPPLKCEPRAGGWESRGGQESNGSPQIDVLYS